METWTFWELCTLYVQPELASLSASVVTSHTIIQAAISRHDGLHSQHLPLFQKFHMRNSVTWQNSEEEEGLNLNFTIITMTSNITVIFVEFWQKSSEMLPPSTLEFHSISTHPKPTHSPSWVHSTLGTGRPLTLHCMSTCCPAMTVSSCTPDEPEITGGAK